MLRANFSNFLNSFVNPIDVDKEDFEPKVEAIGVHGDIESVPSRFVSGNNDTSSSHGIPQRVGHHKTVNPVRLAPQNTIKGKRHVGECKGEKKEHEAAIKKHKLTRTEYDRDIMKKMPFPQPFVEDVNGWKKKIKADIEFEATLGATGGVDHKANKCAANLKAGAIVEPEVINEADVRIQNGLKTRTSPKTLCDTIKELTVEQKAAVKEIGLEKLIGMKLDGIPIKLGFYVVDKFDSLKMVMNVNAGRIPISVQSIHDILGLPMGGIDLMATDPDTRANNIKTIWKKQYTKDRVRPMDIMHEIQRTKDHGVYFKLNFLVMVINVLAECSRVGCCNTGFLSHIKDVGMIAKVDWCKYVYNCLETSKFKWSRDSDKVYYAGPLTYLTMLYVESTSCGTYTNHVPGLPLSKWTLDLLRRRQELEIENGGLGSSVIKGIDGGATKDTVRTPVSGDLCPSTLKADMSKELFLLKLDMKITDLMDIVLEAESMMSHASERFPYDEEVNNLKNKLSIFLKNRTLVVLDVQMLNREQNAESKLGRPPTTPKLSNALSIVEGTTLNHEPMGIDGLSSPLSPIWTSPTLFREMDRVSGQKNDADPNASAHGDDNVKQSRAITFARGKTIMMGSLNGYNMVPGEASNKNVGSGMGDKVINSEGTMVGCADFDPPGFDLGLSPTQKEAKSLVTDLGIATGGPYDMSGCGKREKKPGPKVRSPYMERAVSFVVSRDEITNRDWVMRGIGGSMEKLFVTKCGKNISRLELQTLTNRTFVSNKVIDGWAMVLNDEEKLRSDDSPRRFFFPSDVSGDDGINDPGNNTRETYEKFTRVIKKWCNNEPELISMRNMDLVIFPVVSSGVVYMVVFNLRQPSVWIVDSEKREGLIEDFYDFTPSILLHMMSIHLGNAGNHVLKAFNEMNIEQKKLRWQVVENKIDRGVMLMRNMETFMGGDLRQWDSGLYKESTKQKKQLKDLRVKYASKILMSDLNIKKSSNIEDVQRFIAMEASVAYKRRQDGNRFSSNKV